MLMWGRYGIWYEIALPHQSIPSYSGKTIMRDRKRLERLKIGSVNLGVRMSDEKIVVWWKSLSEIPIHNLDKDHCLTLPDKYRCYKSFTASISTPPPSPPFPPVPFLYLYLTSVTLWRVTFLCDLRLSCLFGLITTTTQWSLCRANVV